MFGFDSVSGFCFALLCIAGPLKVGCNFFWFRFIYATFDYVVKGLLNFYYLELAPLSLKAKYVDINNVSKVDSVRKHKY